MYETHTTTTDADGRIQVSWKRSPGPHWHIASTTLEELSAGLSRSEAVSTSKAQYPTPEQAMNLEALASFWMGDLASFARAYTVVPCERQPGAIQLRATSAVARADGEPHPIFWAEACAGCDSADQS